MLPRITHLQFLILRLLLDGERSGRDLRTHLEAEGQRKTLAAFYQLMSRLEDDGFVRGFYRDYHVDGHPVRERTYEITGDGVVAVDEVRAFVGRLDQVAGRPALA